MISIVILAWSGAMYGVNGAAIDQSVLKDQVLESVPDLPVELSPYRGGNISAAPLGEPCYRSSSQYDLSRCMIVENNKKLDEWVSDQPGGYYYANWASCQSDGQSCSLPLDNSNPLIIPENAVCYNGSVPRMMHVPSPLDINGDLRKAFAEAWVFNLSVIVKNTGHDWKGRGTVPADYKNATTLWTHPLRHPTVAIQFEESFTPVNCTTPWIKGVFHFGPGETWAGAYEFAEQHNRSVVGGTCGTVGIAGWLHGGGHSPLTPVHGMGVDNVLQVEMVTPFGEVKIANECLNPDLFFAVRGGGGNTFGIVTNITYKALPKFEVQDFHANISGLSVDDVAELFDIFTSNAMVWAGNGWGGYIKINTSIELVNSNCSFTLADAKLDMADVISFLKGRNITYVMKTQPSWFNYYNENLKPATNHPAGNSAAVASRLIPATAFEKERRQFKSVLSGMYEQNVAIWLMLVTPTRYNHTHTSALNPTWGSAIWSVRIHKLWDQYYYSAPSDNQNFFELVHNASEPLRKLFPNMGISMNEADIWEPEHEGGFWGNANYERLLRIKSTVDPANILSNWMAVGWKHGVERYKCYPKQPARNN